MVTVGPMEGSARPDPCQNAKYCIMGQELYQSRFEFP